MPGCFSLTSSFHFKNASSSTTSVSYNKTKIRNNMPRKNKMAISQEGYPISNGITLLGLPEIIRLQYFLCNRMFSDLSDAIRVNTRTQMSYFSPVYTTRTSRNYPISKLLVQPNVFRFLRSNQSKYSRQMTVIFLLLN